jgi:hypothetical protein
MGLHFYVLYIYGLLEEQIYLPPLTFNVLLT